MRNRRNRRAIDPSLNRPLADAPITSVESATVGKYVVFHFSAPVIYTTAAPPATWSVAGLPLLAYAHQGPLMCIVDVGAAPADGADFVVSARDPAIRTQQGGFIAPRAGTVAAGDAYVIDVFQDQPNSAYWKFSVDPDYDPAYPLNGSLIPGLHVAAQTPNGSYQTDDEMFAAYPKPIHIGQPWSVGPAAVAIPFPNGIALATTTGILKRKPPFIIPSTVTDNGDGSVQWIFPEQVYTLGAGVTGLQVLGDDGNWQDPSADIQTSTGSLQLVYANPYSTALRWRVSGTPTGIFYAMQIVTPLAGQIIPA